MVDQERFKALNWGLRTWDNWNFNDVDNRFGDDWPGRIPAQLVAHTLFYFTKENDLVFDPMAGGGVVTDTCLAFNRRCWSFDLLDRMKTRPAHPQVLPATSSTKVRQEAFYQIRLCLEWYHCKRHAE